MGGTITSARRARKSYRGKKGVPYMGLISQNNKFQPFPKHPPFEVFLRAKQIHTYTNFFLHKISNSC